VAREKFYSVSRVLIEDAVLVWCQYPSEIEQPKYEYDPSFAIRGLHCDIERVSTL